MKCSRIYSILVIIFSQLCYLHGAKILFLGVIGTKSHKNSFMPLITELGQRGHEVTFLTPIASKKPITGVREIVIEEVLPEMYKLMPKNTIGRDYTSGAGFLKIIQFMKMIVIKGCHYILGNQYIKDVLSGKESKPDVVIASMRENDCNLGIIHKLGVPFIYFSAAAPWPWAMANLRIPNDPTYCPLTAGHNTDRMDFWARLENFIQSSMLSLARTYYIAPAVHRELTQYLGEGIPSPLEIERNCSLIIVNNHFSIDFPRPLTPNVIEAGGMHVRHAKPLPKELDKWMNESGDAGVVFFSLGSSFPGSSMPENYRRAFVEAFSRIPQKVLWKWEADGMTDISPNVRLSKWIPQQDLLGHPELRVFITQGGLLSMMETTFHGVAVLGIPIASDQIVNMKKTQAEGAGLMLTWDTLTADAIVEALDQLINNPQYKERVKHRAAVAKDREMHPLHKAVYWVEYVLRHKGAYHLQPGAIYLTDFQYHMMDIYLFVHTVVVAVLVFCIFLCRCLFRSISKSKLKAE